MTTRPLEIVGDKLVPLGAGAQEIDLRGHFVFPGLVNAHDHLPINSVAPLPTAQKFQNNYQWTEAFRPYLASQAVKAALSVPAEVRYWQGGLKNLFAGATTVAHHDPWDPVLDSADFPVNLLRGSGWCHSLGLAPLRSSFRPIRLLGQAMRAIRSRPSGDAGTSMPGFGPPVLDSFRATPPNKPWIIHLAEGVDDVAAAELGRLDELGCLKSNTVVVHGLALSADDTRRIILAGAAVIWCPSSNVSLYGDTLEPRTLFDAGRLALGTDSRISGSPDLLEELRTAASRSALGPLDLFRLVTDAASAVLMLPDVGGLANGQRADLLIVRDTGVPPHEALLRLRRSDIRAVIRGGMPAIADPDYLPWFQASGINAIPIRLDERPKLLAQPLARKEAVALEPGAEWR